MCRGSGFIRRLGAGEPPLHAGELLGGIEWQGKAVFGTFRQIQKPGSSKQYCMIPEFHDYAPRDASLSRERSNFDQNSES